MGMSLAFHIVFAVAGVAMPLMMLIAEAMWLRSGDDGYLVLAKRWAKGTAILFAVGAVSGTVLSFELGLLWPKFMEFAGSIIGMPFSLEGFAFFLEAIFLGIYFYGWNRVSRSMHLFSGFMVALSGALSALFVVTANGWMNTPQGFRVVNGMPTDIDPVAAMFNPAALPEAAHMIIAAYAAVGFAVAGIHAFLLLKDPDNAFHRKAFAIALIVGGATALLQPLSGDLLARMDADHEPLKLAAYEGHFKTGAWAPMHIGGIPDADAGETKFAIVIPGLLSFLAHHNPEAVVKGLDAFPRDEWPPLVVPHLAFDTMVGCGTAMMLVAAWGGWLYFRTRVLPVTKLFLRAVVLCGPLGFVALEAGWLVTEVGRQPWIIKGVMRTADAVTPMPGLLYPFMLFTLLYIFLAVIVIYLLYRQVAMSPTTTSTPEQSP